MFVCHKESNAEKILVILKFQDEHFMNLVSVAVLPKLFHTAVVNEKSDHNIILPHICCKGANKHRLYQQVYSMIWDRWMDMEITPCPSSLNELIASCEILD